MGHKRTNIIAAHKSNIQNKRRSNGKIVDRAEHFNIQVVENARTSFVLNCWHRYHHLEKSLADDDVTSPLTSAASSDFGVPGEARVPVKIVRLSNNTSTLLNVSLQRVEQHFQQKVVLPDIQISRKTLYIM
jgi:hypothetical protein